MSFLSHSHGRFVLGAALLAAFLIAPRVIQAAPAAERPMPKHFDELGMSDEQKQKTWDTLDDYGARIQKVTQLMRASALAGGAFTVQADTDALVKILKKKQGLALRSILTKDQLEKLDALHAVDVAPEAKAPPPAGDDAKPAGARPLPKFYDQLGLSDEQKENIFKTEDKFRPLIEQQIEAVKAAAEAGGQVEKDSALRVLITLRADIKKAVRSNLTDDQLDKLKGLMGEKSPPKP